MGNLLETVTIEKYPVIREIKEVMTEFGSLGAMMSGSGPTVFGIFADEAAAGTALNEIKMIGCSKETIDKIKAQLTKDGISLDNVRIVTE